MNNKKIPTVVGTVILVIISITAGMFIWEYEKENNLLNEDNYQPTAQFRKSTPTNYKACSQEAKTCPNGSHVSRTGPNCEFAECSASNAQQSSEEITANNNNPTEQKPRKISDISKWKTYHDAKNGIEIRYPPEFSLDTSRDDLVLTIETINPNDLNNNGDAGVMAGFYVSIKKKDINELINEYQTASPDYFEKKLIDINSKISAEQIKYRGVYAGELWTVTLINRGANTLEIEYAGYPQEHVDICSKILSTLKLLKK